ncbi:MAG TPA: ATP-binding protein, partial [Archangium sp.]
ELLAMPREQVIGRTMSETLGPRMAATFLERLRRVLSTHEPDRFEYSLEVGGKRLWFSADALPASQRESVVFLVRDITPQKTLELKLLQADRLAALGTMAAGVAHEVNNPLGYLSSNLHFIGEGLVELKQALSDPEVLKNPEALRRTLEECVEALDEARQGTKRIREVVGDLTVFARGEASDAREGVVDVKRALETSLNMAMPQLKHRARVVRDLGELPSVRGNESKLGQVFLNLLLNAAQAIPEGATGENTIEVRAWAELGGVVVEVRDTGEGIPPENLERIFDPFFSTKPVGVGTGLGLAISHGIITAMQGELSVESKVGKGTCFRVRLPAAQ